MLQRYGRKAPNWPEWTSGRASCGWWHTLLIAQVIIKFILQALFGDGSWGFHSVEEVPCLEGTRRTENRNSPVGALLNRNSLMGSHNC